MNPELLDKIISDISLGKNPGDFNLAQDPKTLDLLVALTQIPKKAAPEAAKQRKYLLEDFSTKNSRLLFHFSRFALGMTMLTLFITGSLGTGLAAYASLPGDAFFPIKKSAEQIQLKFTASPEKKAELQLAFSKKRLVETRKILNSPKSDPQQIQTAVSELTEQSKIAVKTAETAVRQANDTAKAEDIISNIQDLNEQQEDLVKEITAAEVEGMTQNAQIGINENQEKIVEIKKFVEEAKTRSSLVNLGKQDTAEENSENPKPDTTTASGAISDEPKNSPEIKGSSVSSAPLPPKKPAGEETKDPNEVSAGFIVEDPLPQFKE